MNEKLWAVLFKVEASEGVDASPSVGSDLINTGVPQVSPEVKQLERNHPQSGFGKPTAINIGEKIKVSFSMELEADWAASTDTAPSIGKVLRCCYFTETITTGNYINYQNNSALAKETATIWVYKDGLLRKVTGCVGEVKSSMVSGEKVTVEFEFTGRYVDGYASDATFPTFTVSLSDVVIFQNAAVAIGSHTSPMIQNMNWAMNNAIDARPDANSDKGIHSLLATNAAPTCSADPELVALSTFNAFSAWEASSLVTLSAQLKNPNTAAHKCTLTMANMQYKDIADAARVGLLTYDLNFECGGDADVSFKFEGDAS